MSETIEAVFGHGVFTPCAPVSIPDGQRVTLTYVAAHSPEQPPTWPDLPPELVKNGDGTIVARGSRISLFFLLENHFGGTSWTQMQQDYPTVQAGDWKPIECFVRSNEDVLRVYSDRQQEIARAYEAAAKPGPSLEELRQRFQKKYGAPLFAVLMLKLLLDENLRRDALWSAIAAKCAESRLTSEVDIERVGSGAAPALATSDRELLIYCESTKRILISSDTNTMPGFLEAHLAESNSSPGVIFLRDGLTIPQVVELLLLISYAGDAAEYADHCSWVP